MPNATDWPDMDAGASEVTLERPGLRRLIADRCAGKIDRIVMIDPKQLSRDTCVCRKLVSAIFVNASTNTAITRYELLGSFPCLSMANS